MATPQIINTCLLYTSAGDVGRDLDPVGKAHAGNLAQGRVWLLGCLRVDAGAYTAPLRRGLQRRRGRFIPGSRAPLAYELIKSRQSELLTPKNVLLSIIRCV